MLFLELTKDNETKVFKFHRDAKRELELKKLLLSEYSLNQIVVVTKNGKEIERTELKNIFDR